MAIRDAIAWMLVLVAASCAGAAGPSQSAPTTPGPTAMPTPSVERSPTLPSPTATAIIALWSSAATTDVDIAEAVNRAWTDNDATLAEAVYADPAWLLVASDMNQSTDRAEMLTALAGVPNTYERVGPVTSRVESVQGLVPLPAGSRYLHFVDRIHSQLFDIILEVDAAGRVVRHYVDDYADTATRREHGFPDFAALVPSAEPG